MHVYLRLERLFRKYLSVRMLVDTALSFSGTYYKMKKKESELPAPVAKICSVRFKCVCFNS